MKGRLEKMNGGQQRQATATNGSTTGSTTHTCSGVGAGAGVPRLVAFDLDGTIWDPEMYQLWGGGAPFRGDGFGDMTDRKNTKIRLLGNTREIFSSLKYGQEFVETKVAWVSCTDEPDWAETLLNQFKLPCGSTLATCIHSSQIYKANKADHFRRLKAEFPDIAYEDMLFFDNERSNIVNVSKLGVRCVYCPDGLNDIIWNQGLSLFGKNME
jgi:magnesium-dependent phosphatase 1